MGKGICGAETQSGNPCQHPAGENGFCHIPAHNPDGSGKSAGGRPLKLDDPERQQEAIDAAENGMSKSGCARAAGVTLEALNSYLNRAQQDDPDDRFIEFFDRFKRARARGEQGLVNLTKANGDAKFLLATSFGYKKTEQHEVTGEDGGPIQVEEIVETMREAREM